MAGIAPILRRRWPASSLLYVAVTSMSIPGAAACSRSSPAPFSDSALAALIVSFGAALGATIAFLLSRFVLRDGCAPATPPRCERIDRGVQKDGALYLFTLRLIPAVPYFLINLLMGLTAMRAWTFYWVSQLGMLPGTLVYANAGTQLAAIDSPARILSPAVIGAFVLLGIFPLLAKKAIDAVKARRVYSRWKRPARFDRNLVVIGAGSAGLVASYIAAAVRAKVTLIEKHRMGGDCLNTGCVPSKALIKLRARGRRRCATRTTMASAPVSVSSILRR